MTLRRLYLEPFLKRKYSVVGLYLEPSKVLPKEQTKTTFSFWECIGYTLIREFLMGSLDGKVFWIPVEILLGTFSESEKF